MSKYVLLSFLLSACGASFESELLEKGLTDAGASNDRTIASDTSTISDANDAPESGRTDGPGQVDTSSDALLGDSSPDGPGETTDGATPDATADTSQPLACPSNACTDYCLDLGKIDVCTDGECGCL